MAARTRSKRTGKPLAKSTRAKLAYQAGAKGQPVGGGGRFKAMTKALAMKGARSPKALAAWIGRKKYGKDGCCWSQTKIVEDLILCQLTS